MSCRLFTSFIYFFHFTSFLFIFLHLVYSLTELESEENQYGLSIPKDAKYRPKIPNRVDELKSEESLLFGDLPENRCFCSYGHEEGVCDRNKTCIKHPLAACFHVIELIYNASMKSMVTWHKYGCAPLEKGSDASHLTCHNTAHYRPKGIACCYEGNYCNLRIEPPPYQHLSTDFENEDYDFNEINLQSFFRSFFFKASLFIFLPIGFLTCILISIACFLRFKTRKEKSMEDFIEKQPMLGIDDSGSGSGSGMCSLNERTVAQDLRILKVIDQGRYGKVRTAEYRESVVAVKTFNTTEEDSWKNERDIYQTQMLNHACILQFVAADINSEDSITQMLLITDYHEHGSLYDYLRSQNNLTLREAIELAHSSISGIDHLHNSVLGTGSRRKPEIAHRDLKSKNIIVKSPGVCCIADFGLAVRLEDNKIIPEKRNIQVGTKRYMAPELLSKKLDINVFEEFKRADIYSFALVMWEIARSCPDPCGPASETPKDASLSADSGHGTSGSNSSSLSKLYECPFEGMVKSDPSLEEMKVIVCDMNYRPEIPAFWRNPEEQPVLNRYSQLMIDCWNGNPHRRHTALKMKKVLTDILGNLVKSQDENPPKGSFSSKKESDSGIGSNGSSKERPVPPAMEQF